MDEDEDDYDDVDDEDDEDDDEDDFDVRWLGSLTTFLLTYASARIAMTHGLLSAAAARADGERARVVTR